MGSAGDCSKTKHLTEQKHEGTACRRARAAGGLEFATKPRGAGVKPLALLDFLERGVDRPTIAGSERSE
jgi:hypothetical protein